MKSAARGILGSHSILQAIAVGGLGLMLLAGCDHPVERVAVPAANDPSAYRPVPYEKPLPPDAGGPVGGPQPAAPQPSALEPSPAQPVPGQPYTPSLPVPPPIPNQPGASYAPAASEEDVFVAAYQARRNPRIMVFVNRTIQGDTLANDNLQNLINSGPVGGQPVAKNDKYDIVGASRTDYEALELSLIDYLQCQGRVEIRDSDLLRQKMDRAVALRLENNDRSVVPLIKQELGMDYILQVSATPTSQASAGQAVRMLAKMISTTDGRIVAADYQDLPLPLTKTTINVFTHQIARNIMRKTAYVWGAGGQAIWDPLEVRIYKVASVDDGLAVRSWVQKVKGVRNVISRGMTGSSTTAYAVLAVAYDGPPEDLYADLKQNLGVSTGLKAVDLQNNTIDLEVTAPIDLHTVTTTTQTTTTVTTTQSSTDNVQTVAPAKPQ